MTTPPPTTEPDQAQHRGTWLDRDLSAWWCAGGWLLASAVFICLTQLVGGPSTGDTLESVYSTWAIAHGHLACSYFPLDPNGFQLIPPLYPALSGGIAAAVGIGHGVAFPTQAMMGPDCTRALVAMLHWSVRSGALLPTVRIGYLGWFVLAAGLVALLRSLGRGRCGWEPTTLLVVACLPPVIMCLREYFHPQDLVAMGLALGGLACARRSAWFWAGTLLGLAVVSQQFAVLLAVPLIVVAPQGRRLRALAGVLVGCAVVAVPLAPATSGRVLRAVFVGSGNSLGYGGTALWELHLHGFELIALSRVVPILLSIALALWASGRLGPRVLEPVPFVSLMATALALRLVFEVNILVYYFMGIAVLLVVLDVLQGRIRARLVCWVVLVTLSFDPLHHHDVPSWIAQIVLVAAAVAMAASPLLSTAHGRTNELETAAA